MENNRSKIAIILPVYKKNISHFEQISLNQCRKILSAYQHIFVVPESLHLDAYELVDTDKVERFRSKYFQSIEGYNKLMLSIEFYERFKAYDYVLIYQLDCFVFRDELLFWCDQGYDYIGAPLVNHTIKGKNKLYAVGNGGFSLRRVSAHLKILNSLSYIESPILKLKRYWFLEKNKWKIPYLFFKDITFGNNTFYLFNDYPHNEDYFWGYHCSKRNKWFKVPSTSKALAFSFEVTPEVMYELNKFKLPFGCHAWWRYNLDFWKPHIEKFDYDLVGFSDI